MNVRFLYQAGDLEGGTKRTTDPISSGKTGNCTSLKTTVTDPNEPVK